MKSILKIGIDYDLLADKTAERLLDKIPATMPNAPSERKKIFGIRGLAAYIGCSPSKAQALKNESFIPFYAYGNRVFFYGDEVDNALKR